MNALLESKREAVLDLARRYGVTRVRVFGSMAREDATEESDVDLLVDVGEATTGFGLGGLLMDLQDLLGRRVDLVTEQALHPSIRESILSEAVRL